MISKHAYDEIVAKVKERIGEESFEYIFPGIKKALEEGSGAVREEILINWLNVDSMRVCTQCGAIMEEGWYLVSRWKSLRSGASTKMILSHISKTRVKVERLKTSRKKSVTKSLTRLPTI